VESIVKEKERGRSVKKGQKMVQIIKRNSVMENSSQ